MTVMAPHSDRAKTHAERLVEAARAIMAEPNDMAVRAAFVRRCFNIDWLAAAIVTLADSKEVDPA